MTWLVPVALPAAAQIEIDRLLADLERQLADPQADRYALTRELLARVMYGREYAELLAQMPLAALNLDARHVTFEAEYYATADQARRLRAARLRAAR